MAPILGACIAAARRPTPDEVEILLRRMWRDMAGRQALQRPVPGSPEHCRLLTLARAALGVLPADPARPHCGEVHQPEPSQGPRT